MILRILAIILIALLIAVKAKGEAITITTGNTIILRGEVTPDSMSSLIGKLLSNPGKDVYLYQNSPGGSISAGLNFIEAMENSGKRVHCIQAFSASMSAAIMQHCEERIVQRNSVIMFHQAQVGLQSSPILNQINIFNMLKDMVEDLEESQASRIGLKVSEFRSKIAHDWWIRGRNAIRAGVADVMASIQCSQEAIKAVEEELIRTMFGTLKVTWSKCPLISSPLSLSLGGKTDVEAKDAYLKMVESWQNPVHIKAINQ